MPKAILTENFFRHIERVSISDERWKRLRSYIPASLSPGADKQLRSAVLETCSWLFTEQARLREGQATAAMMRSPGKKQLAQFERLAKGLHMAASAWQQMGDFHDDRRSDIRQYDTLEAMARDAERRLATFRKYGKAKTFKTPWFEFVRKIAQNLRAAGLKPTVTGEVYEARSPTWFQKFMVALQEEVLGRDGKPIAHSPAAFAAEIAKAFSYRKPGKARK